MWKIHLIPQLSAIFVLHLHLFQGAPGAPGASGPGGPTGPQGDQGVPVSENVFFVCLFFGFVFLLLLRLVWYCIYLRTLQWNIMTWCVVYAEKTPHCLTRTILTNLHINLPTQSLGTVNTHFVFSSYSDVISPWGSLVLFHFIFPFSSAFEQ